MISNTVRFILQFDLKRESIKSQPQDKFDLSWFHKSYDNVGYGINEIHVSDIQIIFKEETNSGDKVFFIGIYYYMFLFPKELYKKGFSKEHYYYVLTK